MRTITGLLFLLAVTILNAQQFIPDVETYRCGHAQSSHLTSLAKQQAAVSRTDTFDVLHYVINLEIIDLGQERIDGYCDLTFRIKKDGIDQIDLDLLALTVNNVQWSGSPLNYNHFGELLRIDLPAIMNIGDTATIRVSYGGEPVSDASWGGFYFTSNYAYNMGVGFDAEPHNFGRVWFPCVDNFVDRATYDFYITTSAGRKAFCNGLLIDSLKSQTTTQWHWRLEETVPTYLVNVAVADYTTTEWTYNGISKSYPVMLGAVQADSLPLMQSFVNLNDAIGSFENRYGPQPFSRVGFVLVPFQGGAMEHATNIAYPRFAANGNTAYETLMAHELAHHWWGDHVTCRTAEDMWLNEGWASYSEHIFTEYVYGQQAYKESIRQNHAEVLRRTHITDNGYRAVSGVPHEYTYSSTVYDKGADVAHTLRGYLGDTDFFDCLKQYQVTYAFKDASSEDFRDALSSCSDKDLTAFFDNWVFAEGFPHFSIDSFGVSAVGDRFDVTTYLRQRLKFAPNFYDAVPLQLTYYGANWEQESKTVNMYGGCGEYTIDLSFQPVYVAVDMEELISDATTDMYILIDDTGAYQFDNTYMQIDVDQLEEPALIRVEHNWIAPDPLRSTINGLHLSRERYYKVDGIFPNGFDATAIFTFNGTNSSSNGYLDNELLVTGIEDSLVLMYRRGPRTDWSPYPDYSIDAQGSSTNKQGRVIINGLVPGEYALAMLDANRADSAVSYPAQPCTVLNTSGIQLAETVFSVFPNPGRDSFTVQFSEMLTVPSELMIIDLQGATVLRKPLEIGSQRSTVDVSQLSSGSYWVYLAKQGSKPTSKQILIIK